MKGKKQASLLKKGFPQKLRFLSYNALIILAVTYTFIEEKKMTISIPEESSEVVIATIQKEIARLRKKIAALSQNLKNLEKQYDLSSEEFIKKFNNGELGDDEVFFEWYADIQTLKEIQKKLKLLEKVKLDPQLH